MVYESESKDCTIEAQDFYDHDRKMTFTCYEAKLSFGHDHRLSTGHVENMSKTPGTTTSVKESIRMV